MAIAPLKATKPLRDENLLGGGGGRFLRDGRTQKRATGGLYDDNALRKEILTTHEFIDEPGFPSSSVLHVIEVIFSNATADTPHGSEGMVPRVAPVDEKALHASLGELFELPTKVTNSIACEILVKCLYGGDEHKTTIQILHIVRHFDWDAKVVLAVAAFAVMYGEFRLVCQLYPSHSLGKAIALLKQLPEILDFHQGAWKSKFEAIFTLIKAMLDVTKSILAYYNLSKEYFTTETPDIIAIESHIPLAVYWTIRGAIVCGTQILGIAGTGHDSISDAWELSSLAHKLNNINSHLDNLLRSCNRYIAQKKEEEAYASYVHAIETPHVDNSKSLRLTFPSKDDMPLYDCLHKRKASIDGLRKTVVALFLTELDVRPEDYAIVHQMYLEKRENPTRTESQYEVIWVPVMDDWTKEKLVRFYDLRESLMWHSVDPPSVVSPMAIKYFRERCNFFKKPILVVLDTSGKKAHENAIHMIYIWGSPAYPFSNNRERLLWDEETWRLDLIADAVDTNLITWLQEGRHICLYGGEDVEWIRKFIRAAKEATRDPEVPLGIIYVGKRNAKEKITRNIINIIEKEGLSNAVEWTMIWYFWERIECMWYSKGKHLKDKNIDPILKGIIAILSYGSSDQGWALIGKGIQIVSATGEKMYKGLDSHPEWKPRQLEVGFLTALQEYIDKLHIQIPHHCTSLILPTATKEMPDTVACSECGRLMERYTMFRCCTD